MRGTRSVHFVSCVLGATELTAGASARTASARTRTRQTVRQKRTKKGQGCFPLSARGQNRSPLLAYERWLCSMIITCGISLPPTVPGCGHIDQLLAVRGLGRFSAGFASEYSSQGKKQNGKHFMCR